VLNVRKFSSVPFGPGDLLRSETLGPRMLALLAACVRARMNIVISGGTCSGKTTLLGVLSTFVSTQERVITIEDAAELRLAPSWVLHLAQPHVIGVEARPATVEGRGEVMSATWFTAQANFVTRTPFPLALVRSPARWGPTKTSSAQAGDRSQVPLGSKLGDGFASRRGGALSQIAHVENVSEHEQRVGVVGHEVGGLQELDCAPRGGLRLDRGPTEQVRPREQQLASGEGTPIGERDGRLERIGEPEELARPILRSDRLAQEFVDQGDPPDVADRREELPRLAEPALGCLCPAHGYLDEGDPQAMGGCEPCQPVAVENVPPSSLVLVYAGIVTHREGGHRHQGVGDAAGYRFAEREQVFGFATEPIERKRPEPTPGARTPLKAGPTSLFALRWRPRTRILVGPSEVLVSQTVRDLVAGSGLTFEDVGEHEEWHPPTAGTSTGW